MGLLTELLKGEVEARELCGSLHSLGIPQDSERSLYINKNAPSTASALFSAGNKKSHASCTFCRASHTTTKCQVVTALTERGHILLKHGRCFLCLRGGSHLAKTCDADIKCFIWELKVDAKSLKSVTQAEKATSDADGANSNCSRGQIYSKNTSEKPAVLLHTALARIKNPGNKK